MKKTLLAACAVAALSLFAANAQAADVTAPAPEENGFYVSLFGGASFLDDVETDFYSGGYELNTKTGYIVGGAIGMRIWDPLRAEVELSYSRWNADDADFHGFKGPDGTYSADGHVSATYLLANLWYDIGTDTSFTPYVGGGAGVGWADADTTFEDFPFGYGDGEAGFAFQLGAGVKFDVTEHIALDVGYRFKGILDVDFDDSDGEGVYKNADLYSHNVQAGVTFGF